MIRLTLTKTLEKEVDAERPPMDRSNKLMVVDKLERELTGIAKEPQLVGQRLATVLRRSVAWLECRPSCDNVGGSKPSTFEHR